MSKSPSIPTNFSEKLALAITYAKREARNFAKARFAALEYQMAKRDLDFAIANDFPAEYIVGAEERVQEKMFIDDHYEYWARQDIEPSIKCWSSGYQYDDNGNEVWASVEYRPLTFNFAALRHSENGSGTIGYAATDAEAIDLAWRAISDDEEDDEPAVLTPMISLAESDQAGEYQVRFDGKTVSVKELVSQILASCNQGCGQHYELFAKRAKSSLGSLPGKFTGDDRESVEKYLGHARY